MKLTKERRKQLYTQYRWIYALPNGICLLLFIYGNQMIARHYGFDRQGAWMTWGQFLAVGLVVWLAGRVVDAVLGRYAHQWGGVMLTKMNRWAKYLWWLMMIGLVMGWVFELIR